LLPLAAQKADQLLQRWKSAPTASGLEEVGDERNVRTELMAKLAPDRLSERQLQLHGKLHNFLCGAASTRGKMPGQLVARCQARQKQ